MLSFPERQGYASEKEDSNIVYLIDGLCLEIALNTGTFLNVLHLFLLITHKIILQLVGKRKELLN